MSADEDKQARRIYQLAWYHRTKHKRGIRDLVRKTKEQIREVKRAGERRRYRERAARDGRSVRLKRVGAPTEAVLHQEMLANSRRYREKHLERRRKSARDWARRNRMVGQKRFVERYHNDPVFNLAIKTRRRIHMAMRDCEFGTRRKDSVIGLLGCSYLQLKVHIEALFTPGMTWGKCFSGEIHLDHKRPCASFNLLDEKQQRKCFHYTNLQPLWAKENMRKHNKIVVDLMIGPRIRSSKSECR